MNNKLLRSLESGLPLASGNSSPKTVLLACGLTLLTLFATAATSSTLRELSAEQKKDLQTNFKVVVQKRKGPFGKNVCVCSDGRKEMVLRPDGTIQNVCGAKTLFCSAFRTPQAEALGRQGVYTGNLFTTDLHEWDRFPDHHDLVRSHILEKYFIETHPNHKLADARRMRGVSGVEYEAPATSRFAERYLGLDNFVDSRHFLLAYELQERFFVGEHLGQIDKIRNMATQIEGMDPKFKPLRDAVHNQISPSLIPRLTAYHDQLPSGPARTRLGELISEIEGLISLDESALEPGLAELDDSELGARFLSRKPPEGTGPLESIEVLGSTMVLARKEVAKRSISPADARRLIDMNIIAAAVIQGRGSTIVESTGQYSVKQYLRLLIALTDASYGVGLLTERERNAVSEDLLALLDNEKVNRVDLTRRLERVSRIVGWAQEGALLAFAEVWEAWTLLLPEVSLVTDDILRGSPLLLFAQVITRLEDHALGGDRPRHEIMGEEFTLGVRTLNPGIATGKLRVNPKEGSYTRDEVLALGQTPSELQPVSGIVTQGEGNVLSHVQLLARALGIPNAVTGSEAFMRIIKHDGKNVFYVVTPGGRLILKEASTMTEQDHAVYREFNSNKNPVADGSLGSGAKKLDIEHERLDISVRKPLSLSELSVDDSGVRSGPKAAYLGELKRLFPDNVSRGVVLPFGIYYSHYQQAGVKVPDNLKQANVATQGEALPDFVERTYRTFFEELIPGGASEKELREWIEPRLEVVRASIMETPLSAELRKAIQAALDEQGLLQKGDKSQTVGCFVRSDTNVEDLDNFNGAGLNLTLFNLQSLEDIYAGVKEVWASPFTYRSFSWRQPLIDEPLWVLPSIVILESVRSEKSGVLITADIFHGEPDKMVVATSEGVGGAVDGTAAETLLWSPQTVELVNSYKSPWRLMLKPDGGTEVVPSTGKDHVLTESELDKLISAAAGINKKLKPAQDASGKPRPWDIEFGFADGQLWLFQVRPFVGNEELQNIPALASFDVATAPKSQFIALDEVVK